MWVYDIFVSVCARNTAAKWYLPHQEKQHLTQTGRGWAGRPAKRDLTKSLLRKLHERRMHSDQIDHRSIFAKSHTSQTAFSIPAAHAAVRAMRRLCSPIPRLTTSMPTFSASWIRNRRRFPGVTHSPLQSRNAGVFAASSPSTSSCSWSRTPRRRILKHAVAFRSNISGFVVVCLAT